MQCDVEFQEYINLSYIFISRISLQGPHKIMIHNEKCKLGMIVKSLNEVKFDVRFNKFQTCCPMQLVQFPIDMCMCLDGSISRRRWSLWSRKPPTRGSSWWRRTWPEWKPCSTTAAAWPWRTTSPRCRPCPLG